MKVRIINKQGFVWEFDSVAQARPHLKDANYYYYLKTDEGKKIRVYDDRDDREEQFFK